LAKFDPNPKNQPIIRHTREIYSGPLPPPDSLEKYNQVLPGAADRILALTESQARHRLEVENKIVDRDTRLQLRGQMFGFAICLVTIVGGVGLVIVDKSVAGLSTILTSLGILIGSSIYSRSKR
jgi:uncharacterized membrane protein